MTNIKQFANLEVTRDHQWVTVVNPTNRRMLLQACDNCGVVKSENTVVQRCSATAAQGLISSSLLHDMRMTG
jgi:hypothetical protein